jgi:hypothetical protein
MCSLPIPLGSMSVDSAWVQEAHGLKSGRDRHERGDCEWSRKCPGSCVTHSSFAGLIALGVIRKLGQRYTRDLNRPVGELPAGGG